MAKSKSTKGSAGTGGTKALSSQDATTTPPVIIGGGSVNVFFKSNATEIIPSPMTGYRCFRSPGNIKNLPVFDGEKIVNVPILNSKTFVAQTDE